MISFLRHAGWVGPEQLTTPIHIIGCGALGSNTAATAARMGFTNFVLWDSDSVEEHNIPNQAYFSKHLGMLKTDALENVLLEFNPEINVVKHNRFFTAEDKPLLEGYVVAAVDSMSARKLILDAIKYNPMVVVLAEGRLGFDYGEVNLVNPMTPSDISNMAGGLVDDKEVPEGPCNLRICTTLVCIVAGYLVHQLCAHAAATMRNADWEYAHKNVFYLNPTMTNVNFKEKKNG